MNCMQLARQFPCVGNCSVMTGVLPPVQVYDNPGTMAFAFRIIIGPLYDFHSSHFQSFSSPFGDSPDRSILVIDFPQFIMDFSNCIVFTFYHPIHGLVTPLPSWYYVWLPTSEPEFWLAPIATYGLWWFLCVIIALVLMGERLVFGQRSTYPRIRRYFASSAFSWRRCHGRHLTMTHISQSPATAHVM